MKSFKNFLAESREAYITDFGQEMKAQSDGETINIGRYGVWKYDAAKGKHQVVDTGDDLEELKKKHGNLRVVPLNQQPKPILPMQRRPM